MIAKAHAILSGAALERARAARRDSGAPPPDAVAIVDVLRATTTLVHAFAHGAQSMRAFADADAAHRAAAELPAGTAILCGERGGLRPPGFDLGNSPREYVSDFVRGRALHMMTSNGTRAFTRTREARRQLAAAFVNADAVVRRLRALAAAPPPEGEAPPETFEAWLVAAGKDDGPSDEDTACVLELLAGLAAGTPAFVPSIEPGDEGAIEAVRSAALGEPGRLEPFLAGTEHGRALVALDFSFARDIADAARRDAFDVVPEGRGGTIDGVARMGPAAVPPG
jgi:2-phosphosulfolactate phosphatase